MAVVLNPLVKWAQDRSLLYLTVELSNAVVNELEIGEKSLKFQGCGQGAQGENLYKLDITFHGDVDPKLSGHKINDRCITIILKKKESNYWDKLLAEDKKPGWLKTDFDRWREEDDSEEERQDEITKISVEHRRKKMETDLEEKVKEAEEEVKEIVLKGYLLIYNLIQSLAFFYITLTILAKLLYNGADAIPGIFDAVSDLLATCQIAAFIEPINAWFKLVHTGVFAPLSQQWLIMATWDHSLRALAAYKCIITIASCANIVSGFCLGRFIALFLVITPHQELQNSVLVVVLFLAWSLIENVRYPFYSLQTVGYCPRWLLWLRYTAWIPLYPVGLISEGILIYHAANLFDSTGRWSLSLKFLGDVSIPFSLFLRMYIIILVLGGPSLIKHMWSLRAKKYRKTPTRRLKTKNE